MGTGTKVMECTCKNNFQDAIHGAGRRVFNKTAKNDPAEWRCTVCSTTKTTGNAGVKKGEKNK